LLKGVGAGQRQAGGKPEASMNEEASESAPHPWKNYCLMILNECLPMACLRRFLPMATRSPGERKDNYFIFDQELEKNQ